MTSTKNLKARYRLQCYTELVVDVWLYCSRNFIRLLKELVALISRIKAFIALLIIASLTCCSFAAHSEEKWREIGSRIGKSLGNKVVTTVFSTKNEDVWIGSVEGIYRYDGRELERIDFEKAEAPSTPASSFIMFFEDDNQDIFVVTRNDSVQRFDPLIQEFSEAKDFIGLDSIEGEISAAYYDQYRTLWIGYESGKLSRHSLNNSVAWEAWEIDSSPITSITSDTLGDIYALSKNGEIVTLGNDQRDGPRKRRNKCSQKFFNFSAISVDSKGNFWLGTDGNGIAVQKPSNDSCIRPRIQSLETRHLDFSLLSIHDIEITKDSEEVIVGTDSGIVFLQFNSESLMEPSDTRFIRSEELIDIHIVDNDTIWSGTYAGISMFKRSNAHLYSTEKETHLRSVVGIAESPFYGRVVATLTGIYLFDELSNSHVSLKTQHPTSSLRDQGLVSLDVRDKKILVGYLSGGFGIFDAETGLTMEYRQTTDHTTIPPVSGILSLSAETALIATFG
ncbi:hypothetical protein N9M39_00990, partial [Halieaceae bacterium]|nr:hypothetical protein [Halieaceae bacterium]